MLKITDIREGERPMANSCEVTYGLTVRDTVTGYVGKVTAKCDYFGKRPLQYLVEGCDGTGRPIEWWIDFNRLEVVC
mgnify:CR=1 FL=1